jgi:hypothetical protein
MFAHKNTPAYPAKIWLLFFKQDFNIKKIKFAQNKPLNKKQ